MLKEYLKEGAGAEVGGTVAKDVVTEVVAKKAKASGSGGGGGVGGSGGTKEEEELDLVFSSPDISASRRLFFGRYVIMLKRCGECHRYQAQKGPALQQVCFFLQI